MKTRRNKEKIAGNLPLVPVATTRDKYIATVVDVVLFLAAFCRRKLNFNPIFAAPVPVLFPYTYNYILNKRIEHDSGLTKGYQTVKAFKETTLK